MQAVEIADAVGAAGDSAVEEEAAAVAAEASANPPKAEGAAKLLWLQPGEDDIKELFAGYDVNGDGTTTHGSSCKGLRAALPARVFLGQRAQACTSGFLHMQHLFFARLPPWKFSAPRGAIHILPAQRRKC